jgi:hypothetical protein
MFSCQKDPVQRNENILECDASIQNIPGISGIYHHLIKRGNTLFAGGGIDGNGGLLLYDGFEVDTILGRMHEVYDLRLDRQDNLWICVSGGVEGGIFKYSLENELTKVSDRNCFDFEIGPQDQLYFVGGQGFLDDPELHNILELDASNGNVSFKTNPDSNLFGGIIQKFIQSSDDSFWATTFNNELVHATDSVVIEKYSADNEPLFPAMFSGINLLSELQSSILFSFVKKGHWQVIQFDNQSWRNVDLETDYNQTDPMRLIYAIDSFEDTWWISSNWGVYQVDVEEGLVNHFYRENSILSQDHINRFFISNSKEAWISYFESQQLDRIFCQ